MTTSGCCDNPDPRVLEKNGRWFCHNCKRYLTRPQQQDEPPEYQAPDDREAVGVAGEETEA